LSIVAHENGISEALIDPDKQQAVARAYSKIAPMFWGPRIPLKETCSVIRSWLTHQSWSGR